jgi:hypothetical protein
MARNRGYRAIRSQQRREARQQRWQTWFLYVLAAVVAFAAVFGATIVARHLRAKPATSEPPGYVALVTIGAGEAPRQPVAVLVVYNRITRAAAEYFIPRTLLLDGRSGEYVFAGDVMGTPAFADDVQRLIDAHIDYRIDLPMDSLATLAGTDTLWVKLDAPATLQSDGAWRTFSGRFSVPTSTLSDLMGATAKSGVDEATLETALLHSVLQMAALEAAEQQTAAFAAVSRQAGGSGEASVRDVLGAMIAGTSGLTRFPSHGQVSQGQFAYRPDRDAIMALITRHAPGFMSKYTVLVQNGTGKVGVGEVVAEHLAVLNVNLAPPTNADSFDYQQTEIRAGTDATQVAEQIRAILGRGVVLADPKLPADTVSVIIGSDLKAKDLP